MIQRKRRFDHPIGRNWKEKEKARERPLLLQKWNTSQKVSFKLKAFKRVSHIEKTSSDSLLQAGKAERQSKRFRALFKTFVLLVCVFFHY